MLSCIQTPYTGSDISHFVDGDWYRRTEKAAIEKYGKEGLEIKLLLILPFIDDTALDAYSKNTAKPIMATLGNFCLDEIKKDRSKTILGLFPELDLSISQKKQKKYRLLESLVHNKCVEIFLEQMKVNGQKCCCTHFY